MKHRLARASSMRWGPIALEDVAVLTGAVAMVWAFATFLVPPGADIAVIPTITALAIKRYRENKGATEGQEVEPKHPAVKFLLDAWNGGDLSGAHEHLAADCAVSANGLSPGSGPGGPAMLKENVESWRALVPDLRMQLLQEIHQKDRIAIVFRITGTHTGARPDLPASGGSIDLEAGAFLTLDDDRIVEARTVFDALALAVQTGAVEAPAWWPGRP